MPDNFDLYETTDNELEALMADMDLDLEDLDWKDADPWLLDDEFDL